MKTKHELLLDNGWEEELGFCFENYCTVEDYDSEELGVFIKLNDAEEFIKTYYIKNGIARDPESALLITYDEWCCKHLTDNQDIEYKDWLKKMLEE